MFSADVIPSTIVFSEWKAGIVFSLVVFLPVAVAATCRLSHSGVSLLAIFTSQKSEHRLTRERWGKRSSCLLAFANTSQRALIILLSHTQWLVASLPSPCESFLWCDYPSRYVQIYNCAHHFSSLDVLLWTLSCWFWIISPMNQNLSKPPSSTLWATGKFECLLKQLRFHLNCHI